jgi:hypothetical protein
MMKKIFAVVALVMLLAGSVQAQSVANIGVSATVVSSFAIQTTNNLAFGNTIQGGSPTTILSSAAGAGRINVVGANNAGITITATALPSNLTGPASATLGVGSYQYCYVQASALQSSCAPTAVASGDVITGNALSSTGAGFFYLGATLAAPSASQTIGNYSTTAVITITTP